MSHQSATITMHAGDSLPITVTVTADGTESGTPVNLTGATVTFVVARGFGGAAIITKDEADGIDLTGGAQGIAVVMLDPLDTAPEDEPPLHGLYAYWIKAVLDDADATALTPLVGRLVVEP